VGHGFFRKGETADLFALQLQDGVDLTTRALAREGDVRAILMLQTRRREILS
jgi:hypothetical protein